MLVCLTYLIVTFGESLISLDFGIQVGIASTSITLLTFVLLFALVDANMLSHRARTGSSISYLATKIVSLLLLLE